MGGAVEGEGAASAKAAAGARRVEAEAAVGAVRRVVRPTSGGATIKRYLSAEVFGGAPSGGRGSGGGGAAKKGGRAPPKLPAPRPAHGPQTVVGAQVLVLWRRQQQVGGRGDGASRGAGAASTAAAGVPASSSSENTWSASVTIFVYSTASSSIRVTIIHRKPTTVRIRAISVKVFVSAIAVFFSTFCHTAKA